MDSVAVSSMEAVAVKGIDYVVYIFSISFNLIAAVTGIIMCVTVLLQSINAVKSKIILNSEDFNGHNQLFSIMKLSGRIGSIFLILAWLMETQTASYSISGIAVKFAVLWTVVCAANLVLGIISRVLNGATTKSFMLQKKVLWMIAYAIWYSIVAFLIG